MHGEAVYIKQGFPLALENTDDLFLWFHFFLSFSDLSLVSLLVTILFLMHIFSCSFFKCRQSSPNQRFIIKTYLMMRELIDLELSQTYRGLC